MDQYRNTIVEVLTDKHQSFDYVDYLYKYLKREENIPCNRVTMNRYIRNDTGLSQCLRDLVFTGRFETLPGQQV